MALKQGKRKWKEQKISDVTWRLNGIETSKVEEER